MPKLMIAFELVILECVIIKHQHLNTDEDEQIGYEVENSKNEINQMMDGSAA